MKIKEKLDTYKLAGMYTHFYHDGRYADWGDYALQAAYMAIDDINAAKILDRELEMPENLVVDYHCWPEHAEEIAEELFSQNILALTGVDCSQPAVHIARVAQKHKIPAISYGVNASELSDPTEFPYFVRVVTPSEIFDGYLVALAAHIGLTELVFFHTNDAWGLGAHKTVMDFAKKYDVKIQQIIAYERDTPTSFFIEKLRQIQKTGIQNILITAPTPDTITVFQAIDALKMNTPETKIFAAEMISADEKAEAVHGSYGYIAPMTKLFDSALLRDFTHRFQEKINATVDINSKAFAFAAVSYDHIYVIAHAIRSLLDDTKDVTPQNLMLALRNVDFQGVSGRVAITVGTNDRAYMGVEFFNNQGYKEDGTVNFVPVGSLNPSTDEIDFDYQAVKWPGSAA